jgi:hypothetical protein
VGQTSDRQDCGAECPAQAESLPHHTGRAFRVSGSIDVAYPAASIDTTAP